VSKPENKRIDVAELATEQPRELTPQEAEGARGGAGVLPRLSSPGGPPITPNAAPDSPPI